MKHPVKKAVLAGLILAALVAMLVISRSTGSGRSAAMVRTESASAPTHRWLVSDSEAAANAPTATPNPTRRPALVMVDNAPRGQQVANLLAKHLPPGARLVSAQAIDASQVPGDHAQADAKTAGQATFSLPSGAHITSVRERLSRPMALSLITQGQPKDTYSTLPSGSELVVVKHSPGIDQVVIVRPSGWMMTVTLHLPSSGQAEVDIEALARQKLDNTAMEAPPAS